jgi:hypothetical protein
MLNVREYRRRTRDQGFLYSLNVTHQRHEKASKAPLSTVRCMGGLGITLVPEAPEAVDRKC